MFSGASRHVLILAAYAMCVLSAAAVESQPVKVLRIDSGLRLTVEGSLGGLSVPMAVQIEHIALLGDPQFSKQMLQDLCPVGSLIILRGPGPELTSDAFGIVHAIVMRDFDKVPNPAEARTGPFLSGTVRCCVQVELIRAGWAVTAKDEHSLPPELNAQFIQAEREGKARKLGFYSLPNAVSLDSPPAVNSAAPRIPEVNPNPQRPPDIKPNPF